MKKFNLSMLAMAGLLFAGCADKDIVEGGGNQKGETPTEGYMALSINLPTTPSTRAQNDKYDDGIVNEYTVHDCALLLFQGKDEASATLINAQDIILPGSKDDTDGEGITDNVTTTYQATAKVSGYDGETITVGEETIDNNLYALAVLNYKEIMTIDNMGVPSFKTGDPAPDQKPKTLEDFRNITTKIDLTKRANNNTKDYFFMTNAVLSTAIGGTNPGDAPTAAELVQLAELDKTKIYKTADDAEKNPAGDIIVERAVAKATLSPSEDFAKRDDKLLVAPEYDNGAIKENTGLPIAKIEWTLDNREPATFIVRNPGKFKSTDTDKVSNDENATAAPYIKYSSGAFEKSGGNYRFVGSISIAHHNNVPKTGNGTDEDHLHSNIRTDYYRTYWCIDPQYDKEAQGMLPLRTDIEKEREDEKEKRFVTAGKTNGQLAPLYCYENTFNVENQSYQNTTRAIIKVTLDDDANFFTVDGGAELYYDDANVGSDPKAKTGKQKVEPYVVNYLLSNTEIVKAFTDNLSSDAKEAGIATPVITEEYLTPSFERNSATGQYELTALSLNKQTIEEAVFEVEAEGVKKNVKAYNFGDDQSGLDQAFKAIVNSVIETANKKVVINEYNGGVMYYEARFKHFAGVYYGEENLSSSTDLAPWNTGEDWEGEIQSGGTNKAYPAGTGKTAEANYLGRYGMVRNNWYDVEITAFNKIGMPEDPSGQITGNTTPDDNIEEYISARIHVLSWAKRTQGWSF